MVLVTGVLWRITPGSLVPDEDQGFYIAAVILPDGASLQRTDKVANEVLEIIKSNPQQPGRDRLRRLRLPGRRLPQQRRHHLRHAEALGRAQGAGAGAGGRAVRARPAGIKEALVLAFNPPPIFGLGNAGGFEFYIQNRGDGGPAQAVGGDAEVPGRGGADPSCWPACRRSGAPPRRSCRWTWTASSAKALGVPVDSVFDTLAATLGSYYVNDFNKFGRTWQVLMSAEPGLPQEPRGHRPHVGALGQGRDGAGVGASPPCAIRPAPRRWTASTTCRRSSCSARARRA